MKIRREQSNWQEGVLLKDLTTFKVGGPARYFVRVETEEELLDAFRQAQKVNCPVFVLGGGSNLLVSDRGYPGLVIQMAIKAVDWREEEAEIGSGVSLSWLVKESARRGLSGLEWDVAVPGTVGGAICGNAGAPDHSIGQLVKEVRFFDRNKLSFDCYSAEQCCFDYRDSVFRGKSDKVITSVVLRQNPEEREIILKRLRDLAEKKVLSQPRFQPSAGSVFKNPPGQFAGALIEQVGLKGRRLGSAQVSDKHANFIVNLGGAKSDEIVELIELVKDRVLQEFGFTLIEEIIRLPEKE